MKKPLDAYKNAIKQEQDDLVLAYFPALKAMAYRLKERLPASIDVADLISIGTEEMVKLSRKYDKEQNDNFWGYAKKRVNGAMLDYLRSLDPLSRENRTIIKQIDALIGEYYNEFEEEPNDEYLAKKLDLSVEKIQKARINHSISYIVPMGEQIDIYSDENISSKYEKEQMLEKVNTILSSLDKKEQLIMQLYYYEELNFKEISEIVGISVSRACQIVNKILKLLRKRLVNG